MCHKALLGAKFRAFLECIDKELALEMRARGCRRCGGVLHRNRYPRKPRGGPRDCAEAFRLSFSCSVCDKRHTPPSVRFLGRRVYLAATVVLASAVRAGLTEWRVSRLTEWIRVPRQTLERWCAWWQQAFVDTVFFVTARGQFMPPLDEAALPASLLQRFGAADLASRLVAVLRFLAPLSQGTLTQRHGPTEDDDRITERSPIASHG
ncbi:MAG TPA: hypothetical protein VHT52_17765 [Stellaceae bacterium]|jgi:hypothetical protein|nr:hypothetical protein [Stellaceae bacterium]